VNRAIAWFAENHVAANLLMALLVLGGLFTVPRIKQEIFPEIDLPVVTIDTAYPGAAPREVEEAICVRIEEELQGLQGLKRVRSTASEGHGSVAVELLAGEDVRRRVDEIRIRVDGITTFPEDAEPPVIRQADVRFQVLDVAISGDVDERTLKRLGEQARDEILALPGITDVELVAARPYEISIEVSEEALWRYGIAFDDVTRAVRRSSLDLAGGSLKTAAGEILLRTKSQAYDGTDFESLVLLSRPDGTRLTLGEVANVVDGFEETSRAGGCRRASPTPWPRTTHACCATASTPCSATRGGASSSCCSCWHSSCACAWRCGSRWASPSPSSAPCGCSRPWESPSI
jgi:multidrug efflux pump subunit AcrB